MHFEDLLEEIGSFGLYQKLLCFLLIPFTTGICALTFYSQIFILTAPAHICKFSTPASDVSSDIAGTPTPIQAEFLERVSTLLNVTPVESEERNPFTCHQFDLNKTATWSGGNLWIHNLTSLHQVPPPTEQCANGWEYDKELMFSTYTSEHDFVCEEAWRPYLVATLFWVGNTIGSWILGFISDKYGRRPTVFLCHVIYGVAGLASVFVSDFRGFLFLRTMVGFAHHTLSHLSFVLVVEYCGLTSRTVPLLTIMMTYTISSIITPALAWVIWDWKIMTMVSSIPALFVVFFYRWIPESSSWLITKNKSEVAKTQLEKVAKVNGRELPYQMVNQLLSDAGGDARKEEPEMQEKEAEDKEVSLKNLKEKEAAGSNKASSSIIHVFRYPFLRKNVFMVLLVWMMSCMCYYGHCQNTSNLSKNLFLSYLLGAVVEIPSWSVPWLINRFGRKKPLIFTFMIAGIASLMYSVLPQDITWLVLGLALLGRASITGAYYITLQYGPEVFPTVVRGQGVALSETLGGVAIFLSPSIVYLGEIHRTAPLMVFGGLSVLAGCATLLLPETAGVALPQTLPQAELFSRGTQFTLPCCASTFKESTRGSKEEGNV